MPPSRSLDLAPEEARVKDPVCGMMVQPSNAAANSKHGNQTYHFCAELCKRKFQRNPERYLNNEGQNAPVVSAKQSKQKYICPMCPGVEQIGPGSCPKCGMPLEPAEPHGETEADPELASMRTRLIVGVLLGVPLLVLAMGDMLVSGMPIASRIGHSVAYLLQLILATPIVFYCGWPLIVRFFASIKNISPNMFTLIGLGVGVAYLFSLVAFADGYFQLNLFPAELLKHGGYVEPYFESAAMITVLILIGQVLEARARHRTGDAVRKLIRLTPAQATLILPNGRETQMPLEYVEVGDKLRVKVGERFPVDGIVDEGTAHVDESMLTGEPLPVRKAPGDAVSAGTLNGMNPLVMRAERVGSETMLAQVVQLVGQAQRSRIPLQTLVDRISAWFVPIVVVVASLTFCGWWFLSSASNHHARAVIAAVDVLVIACPCALGLATPMAVVVGMGRGARMGILFRSAETLQQLANVTAIAFDKTGTLTEGKPKISHREAVIGGDSDMLLSLAASLERHTDHPLGRAIVWEASNSGLPIHDARNVEVVPGKGVRGTVEGKKVLVGSYGFSVESGTVGDSPAFRMNELRHEGATVVIVAIDGRNAGLIAMSDTIRPSSLDAISTLKKAGIKVVLITGDHASTASAVARKLLVDDVISDSLPTDKFAAVQKLQQKKHIVAMVGDGINDAPALAAADVGIAMGTGTDIAISAAGVTLVRPDLLGVVAAIQLSQKTIRTIRQNLFLAFVYNAAAIPIAAAGLISPMWAAAAMSLSSLSVILNSLRLNRR